MDADGFPLAKISEERVVDDNYSTPMKPKKRVKRAPLRPVDSNGGMENGNVSTSRFNQSTTSETSVHSDHSNELRSSIHSDHSDEIKPSVHFDHPNELKTSVHSDHSNEVKPSVHSHHSIEIKPSVHSDHSNEVKSSGIDDKKKTNHYEITSIPDEYNDVQLEETIPSERPSQLTSEHDNTMVSSYTTGAGDHDVIEIHQFSSADVDAYLDIYFETLDNRLRHYIGQNEQLQQFRVAMKNRIDSNPNAREYQSVLLGKMNGEVVAAVTMSFPGEPSTIPLTSDDPEQNSCLTSIRRWMTRKSNYIPTNMEECYIEMIGVKSAYRNHGIGSAMLECIEHFARQAGANLLTIHINGQQLRYYFERYGFTLDHTDQSSFWKWIVERQSIMKLSKRLLSNEENIDYTTGSYINESIADSAIDE